MSEGDNQPPIQYDTTRESPPPLPLTSLEIEERYRTDEFVGLLATHITAGEFAAYALATGAVIPGKTAKELVTRLSGNPDRISVATNSIFFYASAVDGRHTNDSVRDRQIVYHNPVFYAVPVEDLIYDRHMSEHEFGSVRMDVSRLLQQHVVQNERAHDPSYSSTISAMSDEDIARMFENRQASRIDYLEMLDLARKHVDPVVFRALMHELLELSIPYGIELAGNMKLFLSESDVHMFMKQVQDVWIQLQQYKAQSSDTLVDPIAIEIIRKAQAATYDQLIQRLQQQVVVYPKDSSPETLLKWYALKDQYDRLFPESTSIYTFTVPDAQMRVREVRSSDGISTVRELDKGVYESATQDQIDSASTKAIAGIQDKRYINILGLPEDIKHVIDKVIAKLPHDTYDIIRVRLSDVNIPSHTKLDVSKYQEYIRKIIRGHIQLDLSGDEYEFTTLSGDITQTESAAYPKQVVLILEDITAIKNLHYIQDLMHMIRGLFVARASQQHLKLICVITASAPMQTLNESYTGSPYTEGTDIPLTDYIDKSGH